MTATHRRWLWTLPFALWLVVCAATSSTSAQASQAGWKMPDSAASEKSPLTVTDATIAAGHKIFTSKCEHCHGPSAKGDGEDADPKYEHDMDLTNPDHAAANPDGVVFYKVWNGHSSPKMPAFADDLSREQVWTVVAYVQTLRAKR